MQLIVPILLNCLLVAAVYLTDKYTAAKKLPYAAKQIIIGLLFGCVSAFASEYGVQWLGTVVNVRDAAPLSAGLIFGAPAGIIAGFIGGLYRWFSVAWGAGTYTRLACTMATILAGLMAAGVRKLLFDDKKPTWGYGISIAVVCEVVHMLLIFLTNMGDSAYAFEFVRGASIPMIIGNAVAVGVAIILVSLFSRERIAGKRGKGEERIAQTFQRWLLACIVIAYLLTSLFTFMLQNGIAQIETRELFDSAIKDVEADVQGKSDDYLLEIATRVAEAYNDNPEVSLKDLAAEYGVIEINVVTKDGLVIRSTQDDLVNSFDMNSTDQSREFMVLTEGRRSYVQQYGPVGSDGVTMRKFAGVALGAGGFIQVGYSTEQFRSRLDEFVVDVTKNRHIGTMGFVAVCDEQLNLVTQTKHNGQHISTIGIEPNADMLAGKTADYLSTATVVNVDSGYAETYIYQFVFVEGYCIIAAMPESAAMFMRDASLYTSVFMQVIIFATLFLFIYILIKRVIINNLRKVNKALGRITEGDLDVTVDVRSNAEFASLSDDINTTVTTLKRYIDEATARIDKELEYAKQIQLSALPNNFPKDDHFSIYARMIAAKEVGGDFYDFYRLNDNTVAFLAADVSGKGIPAAMFMMTAKTILKDLAESGIPVNDIFTKANAKLCENNESGMFVTAWMGVLDLTTGKLQFANAGHNPPLLLRAGGEFSYLRTRAGFVLAGMEDICYRVNELQLNPGDRIFLYTDGVTEATDLRQQLYGEDRLLEFMNQNAKKPGAALLFALKDDIDGFAGEAPQFDDITMLILDYKPEKAGVPMKDRTFPAKVDALPEAIEFVEQTLESYDCPMKVQMSVCVAIEELFVNVAHYAYGEGEGDVTLSIGFDESSWEAVFRMSDRGKPFDPLKKSDPDVTLSAEERQIGGLGIFIVKKTMDTVSYAYEDGKNILTMKKKL